MSGILLNTEDRLIKMRTDLEKIDCMVHDLTNYFQKYDKDKDAALIAYDYNRNGVKLSIVEEFVYNMKQDLHQFALCQEE